MALNPFTASHNLVNQVSADSITRPRGFWKAIILDGGTVLSALLLSFLYAQYLSSALAFGWLLLGIGFFAIIASFGMLVGKSLPRHIIIMAASTVALLGFLAVTMSLSLAGLAFGLGFIWFLWAEGVGRHELHNSFEISMAKVVRPYMGKLITGILLMGIVIYVPQGDTKKLFLSEGTFKDIFGGSLTLVEKIYPELDLNTSIEGVGQSIAAFELKQNEIFQSLSQNEQASAIQKASHEIVSRLSKSFNLDIKPDDTLSSVSYGLILRTIESWRTKLGDKFSLLWGIVLFFVIRGISSLFIWIFLGLMYLIYQALLAGKVLQITGETRLKEVLAFT